MNVYGIHATNKALVRMVIHQRLDLEQIPMVLRCFEHDLPIKHGNGKSPFSTYLGFNVGLFF